MGEPGGHSSEEGVLPVGMLRYIRISTLLLIASLVGVIVFGSTLAQVVSIPIIGIALFTVIFVGFFSSPTKVISAEPDWMKEDRPIIPLEELPKSVQCYSVMAKDFWQSPGTVRFEDGTLHFQLSVGKNYSVALEDVTSVRFTQGMNGKVRVGMYGINLRVQGRRNIGFAIKEVEPWRSILLNHVKLDDKHKR